MPPIRYERDGTVYGMISDLASRVERLERGGLTQGKSVQVRLVTAFAGPLPVSNNFTVSNPNSTVLYLWSSTAWNATSVNLVIVLKVDGNTVDTGQLSAIISANVHLAIPTGMATQTGLTVGTHSAQLALTSGTTDANDRFHLLVLELP